MPHRLRPALLATSLFAAFAATVRAQPPIPQPEVPALAAEAITTADPIATGLIGQALQAAIEGARLQGQPDPVGLVARPPVVFGNRGVRINVPGIRINVPGVQIGPEPPAVIAGPPPQIRLAELSRRSWEISERLFAAADPAARADEATNRLLAAARQYASSLRGLDLEPEFNPAEIADITRLNHAVIAMMDALALQKLADAAGPNGPPPVDLRQMAATQVSEAFGSAQLGQEIVFVQPNGAIPPPPNIRPSLLLLAQSTRDLLARLAETDPRLPRAAVMEPLPPPVPQIEPNHLDPIP